MRCRQDPPPQSPPTWFQLQVEERCALEQDLGAQPVQTPRQANSSAQASSGSPGAFIQGGLMARGTQETSTSGMTVRRNQVDSPASNNEETDRRHETGAQRWDNRQHRTRSLRGKHMGCVLAAQRTVGKVSRPWCQKRDPGRVRGVLR